jgi:Domain of unknown function (DUF5658)
LPPTCAKPYLAFVLILAFVFLQFMDAVTTMVFLRFGVAEGNPLIRMALGSFGQPEHALLAAKLFAVALGIFAWRSGRTRVLRMMNLMFAACVVWNVVAIVSTVSA